MTQLIDNSVQVRREIISRTLAGVNQANEFLIDAARAGAPVESGRLRDETVVIKVATESDPVAIGASKAPYAAKVNRGSSSRAAHPFWTSAWIRMKTSFERFFK